MRDRFEVDATYYNFDKAPHMSPDSSNIRKAYNLVILPPLPEAQVRSQIVARTGEPRSAFETAGYAIIAFAVAGLVLAHLPSLF